MAGFSKKAKCFYQKNDPATLPVKSYMVGIIDNEKTIVIIHQYRKRQEQERKNNEKHQDQSTRMGIIIAHSAHDDTKLLYDIRRGCRNGEGNFGDDC